MTSNLRPGNKGVPLPGGITVLRLGMRTMDSLESPKAQETHFSLSSEDEKTEPPSLTVWVEALTPAETARTLMGEKRAAYSLVLYLDVDTIRVIQPQGFLDSPLDVIWDTDTRLGAEGHAGIIGLKRPPGEEKLKYKTLRVMLADSVKRVEILPQITE